MNQLPFNTLTDLFGQCVAVERWARELADSRPFTDVAEVLTRAAELTASLTDKEVRQALGDHPRIGQRAAPGSSTAALSAAEQSGVDVSVAGRLLTANAAYEVRFEHIYLVCAAGRSGEELLADLNDRMDNDPATELGVVRRELAKIAQLRLSGMITP